MKTKAKRNMEVAQRLIDKRFYTESVHCSYYAVLQYMKYVLAFVHQNSIPYQDQDLKDKGSHEFILGEIQNRIANAKLSKGIAEEVRLLKANRASADYELMEFTDIESLECLQTANSIKTKLNTAFGMQL